LQQELFVDHRVERLQLVLTTLCRIGGRLHAPLLILEQTLAKIEACDRLIANDSHDPIESRTLGDGLLSRQRRSAKTDREANESLMTRHRHAIPIMMFKVSS